MHILKKFILCMLRTIDSMRKNVDQSVRYFVQFGEVEWDGISKKSAKSNQTFF